MHPLLIGFLAALSVSGAFAQVAPGLPPPPLPPADARPATPGPVISDPELEPQVTIIRRDTEVVEEVRVGGELRFVKVTPRHGRSYYLVPDPMGNQFIRRDSLETTIKVPLWVLFSW
ncbi:MAG: DUF2782 domain-containing protein [Pseudomonadota bacterium]